MSDRARKALQYGAVAGVVAMTSAFLTQPWEGKVNRAYWDRLGHVWTVCYGETKNVRPGMTMTDQQCTRDLYIRMEADYLAPLERCLPRFKQEPLGLQGAQLDAAWNLGPGAVCNSTSARFARVGKYEQACKALTVFDRAGGHVVAGLEARRKFGDRMRMGELELCLQSVRGH